VEGSARFRLESVPDTAHVSPYDRSGEEAGNAWRSNPTEP